VGLVVEDGAFEEGAQHVAAGVPAAQAEETAGRVVSVRGGVKKRMVEDPRLLVHHPFDLMVNEREGGSPDLFGGFHFHRAHPLHEPLQVRGTRWGGGHVEVQAGLDEVAAGRAFDEGRLVVHDLVD
jgi:hypothetical protein